MKVIAVMNEKGGAGKSTISICLANAFHRQGEGVVLVDSDPQGSARDWREAAGEDADLPPVVGLDKQDSIKDGLKIFQTLDWVIVDTPARAAKASGVIIRSADFVLIPLQPSGLDVWGASAIVDMISAYKDLGGEVKAGFVPTRIRPGTKLGSEIMSGEWNSYGISQLKSVISDRESFKKSVTDGKSIFELSDANAKGEVDCLAQEIKQILEGN